MTAQSARQLAASIDAAAATMPAPILADWLRDRGHESAAAAMTGEPAELRIAAIRSTLAAGGQVRAGDIWTLDRATVEKGHAARTCESLLRDGKTLVVIYTDDSLTACGLIGAKTTRKDADVIHYRKSSGGRWGRSVAKTRIAI
jgi:hypothetical protein